LRELGFVEGQNLVIEYRYRKRVKGGQRDAKQRNRDRRRDRLFDAMAPLAAELVRLKVDVITTSGASTVIRATQQATRTIPIVMRGALIDPVKTGFVDSLARPGGNITGI
jgi:putative ABC transport system substrate-binding protein